MIKRGAWGTRYGFYFAAIGSAFGLGNLWRFPYIVGDSGGGAFVVAYLFTLIFLGLPLLFAELILGKTTRQSVVGALEVISKENPKSQKWLRLVGKTSLLSSVLLLSYYAVVSGWVLYFVYYFFISLFKVQSTEASTLIHDLLSNGWLQVSLTAVHILFCSLVVAKGVQQGIERWIGFSTPIFVILLIFLTVQSLELQGATEAIRFLFYPDFSKFTSQTLIRAVGHAFFTLSLGLGAMVVFGSYLREQVRVPSSAVKVAIVDTLISLCVGVMIFPIVFSGGLRVDGGASLLFETVPLLLHRVGLGDFFGLAFFLCTYVASFGATVGLMESSVSHFVDKKNFSRRQSSLRVGLIIFCMALLPALSGSVLEAVQINGMGILQSLDAFIIHILLPISAVGVAFAVGYTMKMKLKRNEFIFDERESSHRLFENWIFTLRWLVPIVVGSALILEFIGLLKN